jgi:hypothetical protein
MYGRFFNVIKYKITVYIYVIVSFHCREIKHSNILCTKPGTNEYWSDGSFYVVDFRECMEDFLM